MKCKLEVHDVAVEAVVEWFEFGVGVYDARVVVRGVYEIVDQAGGDVFSAV